MQTRPTRNFAWNSNATPIEILFDRLEEGLLVEYHRRQPIDALEQRSLTWHLLANFINTCIHQTSGSHPFVCLISRPYCPVMLIQSISSSFIFYTKHFWQIFYKKFFFLHMVRNSFLSIMVAWAFASIKLQCALDRLHLHTYLYTEEREYDFNPECFVLSL